MPVAWPGGGIIRRRSRERILMHTPVRPAVFRSQVKTLAEYTAPVNVMLALDGRRSLRIMDLKERVARYQFAMAMARNMLSRGMITEDNYHDIDTIMTRKYGLSSSTIYRYNPQI